MLTVLLGLSSSNAQSNAPTGLWTGRGGNTKEFQGHIMFHAELGYWQFELSLRLRINPKLEILRREFEGTYRNINDSTIILYTKKLFINGIPISLDDATKKEMTYALIVLSPGVGGFGIVKKGVAWRMYILYKQEI